MASSHNVLPIVTTGPLLNDRAQSMPCDTLLTPDSSSGGSLNTAVSADNNQVKNSLDSAPGNASATIAQEENMFFKVQATDDVFVQSSTSATPKRSMRGGANNIESKELIRTSMIPPALPFKQTPRLDRMNSPITPANAQGVLPPEACVFVANLPTSAADEYLEALCSEHFEKFGKCHVKVRRDKHKHPFAMVQFHVVEDAQNALNGSHDVRIAGRPIRVEQAQARRSVVLTKVGGGNISPEEAKIALDGFGPISNMRPTTNQDARFLGVPEGMWIEFAYYLDYKDALKAFNSSTSQYRITVVPERGLQAAPEENRSPSARDFCAPRSSTDQKSIFVGNLPHDTTDNELMHLFSGCGLIRAINIIRKPLFGGSGYNIFGFVEFNTIEEAENAASMEVELKGVKIRVEPKEYSARRHTRLQNYNNAMSPFQHDARSGYHQGWGRGPAAQYGYKQNFHPMHAAQHIQHGGYNYQDMGSFHHPASPHHNLTPHHHNARHHRGSFSTVYATPPPSSGRMAVPRRNDMLFTGSPHHMPTWSPFVAANANFSGGAMMQIPEEMEGQHY